MTTNLENLIQSIKYAKFNNPDEVFTIGGGDYTARQLFEVVQKLDTLKRYEENGVTCQTYGHTLKLITCAECNC